MQRGVEAKHAPATTRAPDATRAVTASYPAGALEAHSRRRQQKRLLFCFCFCQNA